MKLSSRISLLESFVIEKLMDKRIKKLSEPKKEKGFTEAEAHQMIQKKFSKVKNSW